MKRLIFLSLVIGALCYNCSKKEDDKLTVITKPVHTHRDAIVNNGLYDSIGYFHNKALELSLAYRLSCAGNYNRDSLAFRMIRSLNVVSPNYFPLSLLTSYSTFLPNSSPLFLDICATPKTTSDLYRLMKSNFNFLVQKGVISNGLGASLAKLFSTSMSYSNMRSQLIILRNGTTSQTEISYLNAGLSTLDASYNYKMSHGGVEDVPNRWQVYAWDAAGGIAGLYGGPVWSIIQGAVVSGVMDPIVPGQGFPVTPM